MSATANIPVGATATRELIVEREMTVAHFVESMPEVYGTPIMIFHMETTSGAAIENYLPEGLSEDELTNLIKDAIKETHAQNMQDMGKVMGILKPKVQGRADMSLVSQKIKALLQ